MFICDECNQASEPREKPVKRVAAIREKAYRDRFGDVVGHGHETVREEYLCTACAGLIEKMGPPVVVK